MVPSAPARPLTGTTLWHTYLGLNSDQVTALDESFHLSEPLGFLFCRMSKNNLKKRKRGFINYDVCTMSGDIKISVRKDGREGGKKESSQKLEEGGIISPLAIWDLRLGRMAYLGTVKRSEPCTDTSIAISSLGPSGDIA